MMSELEDIITLSEEQEKKVEPILEDILLWHRTQRLPQYVKWVDEYKERVNKGYDKQDMQWLEGIFQQEIELFFNKVVDDFAPLVTTITPQQIKELQEHFDEKNEEYEEDILELDKEEYYEELEETAIEDMEDWVDDLTPEQIAFVKQSVAQHKDLREIHLAYRKTKQQQWIDLLKARIANGKYHKLPIAEFKQKMADLVKRIPNKNDPNDYLTLYDYNQNLKKSATLSSMKIITKAQKEYLLEEVDSYRSEFVDLIED